MHKRGSIIAGLTMIVFGLFFLLINLFPNVAARLNLSQQWPLIIIAIGLFFLLSGLASANSLTIPGSILTGIGAILYYQNATGNWSSWSYMWALIPGFVGIGHLLSGARRGQRSRVREGTRLLGISVVLFVVFAFFFTGLGSLRTYWPVLLILIGLWMLLLNLLKRFR